MLAFEMQQLPEWYMIAIISCAVFTMLEHFRPTIYNVPVRISFAA
jgi:hypothetical protein